MSERPTAEELQEQVEYWQASSKEFERLLKVAHQEAAKQLAQLTLERDQLREQCAYNQLTIEALTAKLAKADRMEQ